MKHSRFLIVSGLMLGLSRAAFAIPCDGVTTCERPDANGTTQAGWSVSASGVSGIKALVSVGPTGNQAGSQYYFGVNSSNVGATIANGGFLAGGSGARVISTAFATNASQTNTSTVFGGAVQQILGNTAYFVYAQACPSGTGIYNSAGCSAWTLIGNFSSSNYPASVFAAPQAPADASINSISARTNVPTADQSNISLIRLDIHDLITPANNQTLAPIGFGGANGVVPIDNTMYTQNGGFKPNVKYEYLGKVVYPFNVDVPAAGQTRGPFWTTPAQPGTVSVSNITHCSAQITSLNSSGAPSNPAYTTYNLCASGTGGSCATDLISGATAGDSAVATINNLNPGTNYTPTAQALVGNGDGSSSGWNSSSLRNGSVFSTLAWGGTFTVGNVTTTSADFTISGLTGAGSIASWAIRANGVNQLTGTGDPTGTHTKSGLIPNTVYGTVQIVLTETSGCSSTLNFTPGSFTTTPFAPTSGSFSNVLATSLQVNWVDGSANPNGSTYEINLCTDAGFTTGCQTNTVNKPTLSTTFTVSPTTTYFARVRTRNTSRPTWPDSAYLNVGSVTTPVNQSGITISPNPANAVTGTPLVFNATVVDQTGTTLPGQAVNWSYSGGNGQISPLNGASTTLTASSVGSFVLTASLAGYPNATANVTVVAAGPFFVTSPTLVMNPGNITGNVSARGNDNVSGEPSLSYTWTLESGPSAISVTPNANHAARDAVVTFSKAGSYVLRCTISNSNGSAFQVTSSVVIPQVLSSLQVCPSGQMGNCPTSVTLRTLQDQQFVANGVDQFGETMTASGVTWSATGAGSINSAGVFNSSQIGTNVTVTAQSGSISGAILVSLVSFDVSNAKAYPVPFKASAGISTITFDNLGSQATIHVYTTSGRRVFDVSVNANQYNWDVKNTSGESIASGVYFYVIESPEGKKNGKLIIIK